MRAYCKNNLVHSVTGPYATRVILIAVLAISVNGAKGRPDEPPALPRIDPMGLYVWRVLVQQPAEVHICVPS